MERDLVTRLQSHPNLVTSSIKMVADTRRKKLLDFDSIYTLRAKHPNTKLVHCHGVFDVLHAGHLAYFESAKKFGDILVVTVTADEFVNKGPGRPYFNSAVRANMLAALEVVDYVVVNRTPTAVSAIEALKPHFYVKGPDYKDKIRDVTGAIFLEESAVEKHGGKLVFTEDEIHSSSTLINRFFTQWTQEQTKMIESVQAAGGYFLIEKILEKISHEKVGVIGEPIIDNYVFCRPESISSKSPSVSAQYLYQEDYAGGTLAIANHLCDFVKETTLITTHGGESQFENLLNEKLDKRIKLVNQRLPNIPTPKKTRFIAIEKSQRIFELTDLRFDQWRHHSPKEFCSLLKHHQPRFDTTLFADFGHGLFENSVLETTASLEGFICVNVQTNSSNFGFNPFKKHKKFAFLSIDTKEARIAYHDRFTLPLDLARQMRKDLANTGASLTMTLGQHGAFYFPKDNSVEYFSPAFADEVIDPTGAGDAFFALTSLLVKTGCPNPVIPFLGNVFAGLKTRIIGNKAPVSKAQFIKAVSSILK